MDLYYDNETKTLDFSGRGLTEFPCEIPDDCTTINCHNNKLKSLPKDLKNVRHLDCYDNELTFLPDLKKVSWLWCQQNRLTSLPILKNVEVINCYSNPIKKIDWYNYKKFQTFQIPLYDPIHTDHLVKKIQRWYKARRLTRLGIPKLITYYAYGFV